MSQKKIRWGDARQIGFAIANKAFEHLVDPIVKRQREFVQACYDATLRDLGLTGPKVDALAAAGLLNKSAYCMVEFTGADGDEAASFMLGQHCPWGTPNDKQPPCIFVGSSLAVDNPAWLAVFSKLKDESRPYHENCTALANAIVKQIEGRSAAYVMKEWPEAASFVAEALNLNITPIIKPLDTLLVRFLLALPAPIVEKDNG
jgi:hypothetical protein